MFLRGFAAEEQGVGGLMERHTPASLLCVVSGMGLALVSVLAFSSALQSLGPFQPAVAYFSLALGVILIVGSTKLMSRSDVRFADIAFSEAERRWLLVLDAVRYSSLILMGVFVFVLILFPRIHVAGVVTLFLPPFAVAVLCNVIRQQVIWRAVRK